MCIKLVELCHVCAKEASAEQNRYNTIKEEDWDRDLEQFHEVLKRTTNIRCPLYCQNSLDFVQSAKVKLHGTDTFSRYSGLQNRCNVWPFSTELNVVLNRVGIALRFG